MTHYLVHEWAFYPLAVPVMISMICRLLMSPVRRLIWILKRDHGPLVLIEMAACLSAILLSITDTPVPRSWRAFGCCLALMHILVLCRDRTEERAATMAAVTVFWVMVVVALVPRSIDMVHVAIIPLIMSYAVTTISLVKHCDECTWKK